jgi:hypothetical protein
VIAKGCEDRPPPANPISLNVTPEATGSSPVHPATREPRNQRWLRGFFFCVRRKGVRLQTVSNGERVQSLQSRPDGDDLPLLDPDLEAPDRLAQRRPGERRLRIEGFPARSVRDLAKHVLPRAVGLSQADEGSSRVVVAPSPQLESLQVFVEDGERVADVPATAFVRGNDEVVRRRLALEDPAPAGELRSSEMRLSTSSRMKIAPDRQVGSWSAFFGNSPRFSTQGFAGGISSTAASRRTWWSVARMCRTILGPNTPPWRDFFARSEPTRSLPWRGRASATGIFPSKRAAARSTSSPQVDLRHEIHPKRSSGRTSSDPSGDSWGRPGRPIV